MRLGGKPVLIQLDPGRIGIHQKQIHVPVVIRIQSDKGSPILNRIRTADQGTILELHNAVFTALNKEPIALVS
jgi:hypothetical protein